MGLIEAIFKAKGFIKTKVYVMAMRIHMLNVKNFLLFIDCQQCNHNYIDN